MNKRLFKIIFKTEGFPGGNDNDYVLGRITGMMDLLLFGQSEKAYAMVKNTDKEYYQLTYETDFETLMDVLRKINSFYPKVKFKVF